MNDVGLRSALARDYHIWAALALSLVTMHALTNGQYGFHRDELAVLDDAHRLAWGYVAYPPLTPMIASVALDLFGPSLVGLRLFSSLALAIAIVLTGMIAGELGGGRRAQIIAAAGVTIAPINSGLWRVTSKVHDTFVEEVGWPDLVDTVADVYGSLPTDEKSSAAILAGNYGEAGAIDLYGPALGLPRAISGADSYWLRGYGVAVPHTIVVLGFSPEEVKDDFTNCEVAGHVANRYAVANEETTNYPTVLVCRGTRQPWPVFWSRLRSFN